MKWFLEMVCDMQLFPFFFHMDNQWPDVIYWNVHSFSTNQSSNGQLCANWKSVPSLRQSDWKNHPIWMGQLVKKKSFLWACVLGKDSPSSQKMIPWQARGLFYLVCFHFHLSWVPSWHVPFSIGQYVYLHTNTVLS